MARTCVWCGGAPLTNEDAVPQWIMERFYARSGALTARLASVERQNQQPPEMRPTRRVGSQIALAKRVCAPCNNGWMSGMEGEAQPYLKAMMSGISVSLDGDAQKTVAAWATKTAFMLTYTSRGHPHIHEDQLRWVYEHRIPPAGTGVWLGAYSGRLDGKHDIKHVTVTSPLAGAAGAHLVTLALARLIVQVWVWDAPSWSDLAAPFAGDHSRVMRRIWPVGGLDVLWPPSATVDDRGFQAITLTASDMVDACLDVDGNAENARG